jgi:membrane protein involved in colicin uptake
MMVALLLYAYCVGVFSSRRIERATHEDVAFRVLTGGEHPHFTRIAAFRRVHIDAFHDMFVQTVKLCQHAGMVKLGLVALDGTKMQGNASKHKAMSYDRMQKEEQRLQKEIASLLERAEQADRSEDARFGEGQREEDLPEELRRREGRLAKIQAAKHALEQEALLARAEALNRQAEEQERSATNHPDPTERKRAATRAAKRRKQAASLQRSATNHPDPTERKRAATRAAKRRKQAASLLNKRDDDVPPMGEYGVAGLSSTDLFGDADCLAPASGSGCRSPSGFGLVHSSIRGHAA